MPGSSDANSKEPPTEVRLVRNGVAVGDASAPGYLLPHHTGSAPFSEGGAVAWCKVSGWGWCGARCQDGGGVVRGVRMGVVWCEVSGWGWCDARCQGGGLDPGLLQSRRGRILLDSDPYWIQILAGFRSRRPHRLTDTASSY